MKGNLMLYYCRPSQSMPKKYFAIFSLDNPLQNDIFLKIFAPAFQKCIILNILDCICHVLVSLTFSFLAKSSRIWPILAIFTKSQKVCLTNMWPIQSDIFKITHFWKADWWIFRNISYPIEYFDLFMTGMTSKFITIFSNFNVISTT